MHSMGKPGDVRLGWGWQYTGGKGDTGKPHFHQMRRAEAAQKRARGGGETDQRVPEETVSWRGAGSLGKHSNTHVCTDNQTHLKARFKL